MHPGAATISIRRLVGKIRSASGLEPLEPFGSSFPSTFEEVLISSSLISFDHYRDVPQASSHACSPGGASPSERPTSHGSRLCAIQLSHATDATEIRLHCWRANTRHADSPNHAGQGSLDCSQPWLWGRTTCRASMHTHAAPDWRATHELPSTSSTVHATTAVCPIATCCVY